MTTPRGAAPPSWPAALKILLGVLGLGLEVSLGNEEGWTREEVAEREGRGALRKEVLQPPTWLGGALTALDVVPGCIPLLAGEGRGRRKPLFPTLTATPFQSCISPNR